MPVIGVLGSGSVEGWAPLTAAFRQGLSETGYTEDRNLAIEYQWADGHYDRLPEMAADFLRSIDAAAKSFAITATAAPVRDESRVESIVKSIASEANGGLFLPSDTFTINHRALIIQLAARYRVPALYAHDFFTHAGGLASYSVAVAEQFAQAADYADRIFNGAHPGDLPVQQPTKFDLTINLTAAKALGLTVPATLLARADEVIE
jgi:putative tryptophan/tyrosine transport system substrate-binding protein